jgi:hypothetical protein
LAALTGKSQTQPPSVEMETPSYHSTDFADSSSDLASKLSYVRPTTADNGVPFPSTSGYIDGYPVKATGGYSTLTIDNSKNSSDMFVKLYALTADLEEPVSVFFVKAGEQFTVEDIKPGSYDVRFRNLNSGGLSKSEAFELTEIETAEGIEYQAFSLTLYTVDNGNMEMQPISEDEF